MRRGPTGHHHAKPKPHSNFPFNGIYMDRETQSFSRISVHQWVGSAIHASQQHTSPIGFLSLKLLPPPCAVLLVQRRVVEELRWTFTMEHVDSLYRMRLLFSYHGLRPFASRIRSSLLTQNCHSGTESYPFVSRDSHFIQEFKILSGYFGHELAADIYSHFLAIFFSRKQT